VSTNALFGFIWISEEGNEVVTTVYNGADGYPDYLLAELQEWIHDHSAKELYDFMTECRGFRYFPKPQREDHRNTIDFGRSDFGNFCYVYLFNRAGELVEHWRNGELIFKDKTCKLNIPWS